MKVIYCDCCGKEIKNKNHISLIHESMSVRLKDGRLKDRVPVITVNISAVEMDTPCDVCLHCLIDAINKKDKRPQITCGTCGGSQ